MIRTGSMELTISARFETGARMSHKITLPVCVPTANSLARCPGTSVLLMTGPAEDIGVKDGEDVVEAPVNPSKGSSNWVCTA